MTSDTATGEVPSQAARSVVFSVIVSDAIEYVDLRASASTDAELLTTIPANTTLGVIGLKNNYYKVIYSGMIGRVLADYLIIQNVDDAVEAKPELSTDPIRAFQQDSAGRLVPSSVSSFNYVNGIATRCSYITRLNLAKIT